VKVYKSIEKFSSSLRSIVTIGTFDGIHIGHRYILKNLMEISKKNNEESIVITFNPHPRYVLQKENQELKLINTTKEKEQLLEEIGIAHFIIHPFTKQFSRTKSENFIRDFLVNKLNVSHLILGHDHHFGRNREGSFDDLKRLSDLYDFRITQISAKKVDSTIVSSTKIRNKIKSGDIKIVNKYLGYTFFFSGLVIKGLSIGKKIDFPTANLSLEDDNKIIPKDGVYAVKVKYIDVNYIGMMNIGFKPTLMQKNRSIEVNIFDFDLDIYGKYITVSVIAKIRDERKFKNLDELKKQLIKDKRKVKTVINKISSNYL
tara:strand:+ start:585 stop:1532 length:948 start_codon:yes stop_codon:yes gene_type:complete